MFVHCKIYQCNLQVTLRSFECLLQFKKVQKALLQYYLCLKQKVTILLFVFEIYSKAKFDHARQVLALKSILV